MHTFLHKKFKFNLNALTDEDRLLIAISGGQDSMCLVKLVYDCLENNCFQIEAIYIDHQWKKDSLSRIKHIVHILHQNSIPISIYQIQTQVFSENEARKLRYKTLIKHALTYKYTKIITGHNQNDKIETAVQNVIRGTGLNGLTNMSHSKQLARKISIIRPLINFTRSEIMWFCRYFCLPVWSDITNYNYNLNRNKIRYELLPYLKNYFNPNIVDTIYNFLQLCQQENEYIRENTLRLYAMSNHKNLVGLNFELLKKQHIVLQKRVLQLYLYHNFSKNINQKAMDKLIEYINNSRIKKQIIELDSLYIQNFKGWIYIRFSV